MADENALEGNWQNGNVTESNRTQSGTRHVLMIAKWFIKGALIELFEWGTDFCSFIPGRLGNCARTTCFFILSGTKPKNLQLQPKCIISGFRNIKLGTNVSVMRFSKIQAHDSGKIAIGANVGINANSTIDASGGGEIEIADEVMIAQNCVLRAADYGHSRTDISITFQGYLPGKIRIGKGAWIGANSVITRNVSIGEHSIIAAGALWQKISQRIQ